MNIKPKFRIRKKPMTSGRWRYRPGPDMDWMDVEVIQVNGYLMCRTLGMDERSKRTAFKGQWSK